MKDPQGLVLHGSVYGINAHQQKPHVRVALKPRVGNSANDTDPTTIKITTVDGLMNELRRTIHSMFCTIDSSISTIDPNDNYARQAFRYFTTTNTITPEAFHHKVAKLGLKASRLLCLELFGRIDQEDLGEINYATFARRIFLCSRYLNVNEIADQDHFSLRADPGEINNRTISDNTPGVTSSQSLSADRSPRANSPMYTPRQKISSLSIPKSPTKLAMPNDQRRMPNQDGIVLIYEHLSLEEIENLISQKLEEKISRSTDRFRQAFRFFTKSEGITFAEFHHHLDLLQIHLSSTKSRALFNRFDTDGNGTIELAEFAASLFNKRDIEADIIQSSNAETHLSNRGVSAGNGIEIFEVQAGSTLSIEQIMAKLRDKLEQHTSKESDRFRQAFKIFSKSTGISPYDFNVAMGKLGLKLTEKQLQELFEMFDFDKSGDLDLNEFVQGIMLDDYSPKFWLTVKDRQKLEETRRRLYSMAVQSVQNSWTIPEIEQMLREKIEQRTSRSSDCFRQAFRIFKKVNGIKPDEFHAALERIGLALDRSQSDVLFARFDKNGSGDIDLDEFIHGVLPPDYTGRQWVAAADEMHRITAQEKKLQAKMRPDQYMTEIEMENWSLDVIEKLIRDKIQQATSKSSDTFRQAYKIFKKSNHVTMEEFRERLLALGFRLTPAQCQGLFRRYDTNNSNDIDLQEFCMRILPPDYTGDGDYWSHSDNYKKAKQREKLEYVKRTKNGLLMLPKFDESRRYTRALYTTRTFDDLIDDNSSLFKADGEASTETSRPGSPVVNPIRPPTPRSPRPPSVQSSSRGSTESLASSPRPHTMTSSPRKVRVASATSSDKPGPPSSTLDLSSVKPPTPTPQKESFSPRSPRPTTTLSPSKQPCDTKMKQYNTPQYHVVEYEDEEVMDDDEGDLAAAIELVRAARHERRRHRKVHGNRRSQDVEDASVKSTRNSPRYEPSVTSNTSAMSTASVTVGVAKYTPQKTNVLLIRKFLQMTKRKTKSISKGNESQGSLQSKHKTHRL